MQSAQSFGNKQQTAPFENCAMATLSLGNRYLEICERSLMRVLNSEYNGVTVLIMDKNGYECDRCHIPADVLPDYLHLWPAENASAGLQADIVHDARCLHTAKEWPLLH